MEIVRQPQSSIDIRKDITNFEAHLFCRKREDGKIECNPFWMMKSQPPIFMRCMWFNLRFITSLTNALIDTVTTAVDCTPLCAHDSFNSTFTLDIARETWNFRDDDDNLNRSRNVNLHRHGKKKAVLP
jgi:hypothetical protein